MTHVTAELFADPYAVACWRHRPTLRHIEYKFPEVEWIVRPIVSLAEPLDGDAAEEYAVDAERAAAAAGLPLADAAFGDRVPASWAACETLAVVREADPEGALALFHRLSTQAFASGRPTAAGDDLADEAAAVAAVDRETVREAIGTRRSTATVGTDMEAGQRLVGALPETEVRGDPSTIPLEPRTFGGGRTATGGVNPSDSGDGDDADDPNEAGTTPKVPAPPLVRFRNGESTVVVDPAKGYDEFADVLRTFDPDMGETDYSSQLHGREVIRAYSISKRVAEQMTSEDYRPKIKAVLERLDEAFLSEIANCTDLDSETCRRTLAELQTDREVRRSRTGAWHLIRERTD